MEWWLHQYDNERNCKISCDIKKKSFKIKCSWIHCLTIKSNLIKRNLKKFKSVRTLMESLTRIFLSFYPFNEIFMPNWCSLVIQDTHSPSFLVSSKICENMNFFIQLAITACLFSSKFQSNWPQHSWIC